MLKHMWEWDIKAHARKSDDVYEVSMDTYWKEVDMNEWYDLNYERKRYKMDQLDTLINGKTNQEYRRVSL